MNKYVYLFELDSVRKTDEEILIGQKALYHEIVDNGNIVVLTLNQICDSRAFFSLLDDEEDYYTYRHRKVNDEEGKKKKRFEKDYYKSLLALFEMGMIRISMFGKYRTIAGYLIDSLESGRRFVYSGWPLKSTQRNLIELIKKSLLYSDLSEIYAYKEGKYSDIKLIELFQEVDSITGEVKESQRNKSDLRKEIINIYWFLKLVLQLSIMHEIYISPRKIEEYKSVCLDDVLNMVFRFDRLSENDLWENAIQILKMAKDAISKEGKKGSRSEYILKLKEYSLDQHLYAIDKYMYAEAILNLCYNYVNEISIRNTSKRYNYKELIEKESAPTFQEDFLRRLKEDWKTGIPEHKYLQKEIDHFDEYTPSRGFPKLYKAVRIIRYTQFKKSRETKNNTLNSFDNNVLRYEKNYKKECNLYRKKIWLGIKRTFLAVFVCMLIVIALEFLMQYIQDYLEENSHLSSVIIKPLSTIVVLFLTEIISVVISKAIHGFLSLSDALSKLCYLVIDSFGNIWRMYIGFREGNMIEKNAHDVDEVESYNKEE